MQRCTIYPPVGPRQPLQSPGEGILYELFRDKLGPAYRVVHSVRWDRLTSRGYRQPGEADFVIVHPERGVLVLEVKHSPHIRYANDEGSWVLEKQDGSREDGGDPFHQAMKSAQLLLERVRTVAATKPFSETYRINYAVWLTGTTWDFERPTGLRDLDGQVLDRRDLVDPEGGLVRVFRHVSGEEAPTPLADLAVAALLCLLEPGTCAGETREVFGPFSQADLAIKTLTDSQQERVTELLRRSPRLAIPGHAGTGKTVVAQEAAWHLAQRGEKVLLLCANLTLAVFLRGRVAADPRPNSRPFEVLSLHELVKGLAEQGRQLRSEAGGLDVTRERDQEIATRVLAENLRVLPARGWVPPYTALLVDEAQDINPPLWPLLRRLMAKPAESYFVAFYDLAQRDLPGGWDPGCTGLPVLDALVENCRNSGRIYELMSALNPALRSTPHRGDPGEPIRYVPPQKRGIGFADAETQTLERVLDELVDEGWRPEDILVVTCRSWARTRFRLAAQRRLGRHQARELGAKRPGYVQIATIRASKGLESPAVVLVEMDGLAGEKKRNALLYSAVARARTLLVVLGEPSDITSA